MKNKKKNIKSYFPVMLEEIEKAKLFFNIKKLKEIVDNLEDFSIELENIKESLGRIEGALFGPDDSFRQNTQAIESDQIENSQD